MANAPANHRLKDMLSAHTEHRYLLVILAAMILSFALAS